MSSPAMSAPMSTSSASSDSSSSSAASSSSRPEGTISGSGGTIKAGAGLKLPAKLGSWIRSAGSGSIIFYKKGELTVTASFLPGSDYTGIQENVSHSRTKVGSGVCGSTADPTNLLCYLKTADGVISLSAAGPETPLIALVDFADQLTKALGKS